MDDEEGEAPGNEGVGAAHKNVGGEIDGSHTGGTNGTRGHANKVGVGPEKWDEEKAGKANGDGATSEEDHKELGDDHNVETGDGEDVHGAGADEGVADVFGEGRAFAEEDGAVEVRDVGCGMFEANAHASREVVAERGKSAAEGVGGRRGDAAREGVGAFDPKAAGTEVGRVGARVEPAGAVPGFTELGRGIGGGEGRDHAEGDVGVGGKEGEGAFGRGCFAAEGGVAFDGEGVVESGAMSFCRGVAKDGDARLHRGEGKSETEKKNGRQMPKAKRKSMTQKCREKRGESDEGPSGSEVVVGKAEGFTGGEGRANQEIVCLEFEFRLVHRSAPPRAHEFSSIAARRQRWAQHRGASLDGETTCLGAWRVDRCG